MGKTMMKDSKKYPESGEYFEREFIFGYDLNGVMTYEQAKSYLTIENWQANATLCKIMK